MPDPYAPFTHLRFDRPSDRILRITLDGPGLNAVDSDVHRELADVWVAVDRDRHPARGVLARDTRKLCRGDPANLALRMREELLERIRIGLALGFEDDESTVLRVPGRNNSLRCARDSVATNVACGTGVAGPLDLSGARLARTTLGDRNRLDFGST